MKKKIKITLYLQNFLVVSNLILIFLFITAYQINQVGLMKINYKTKIIEPPLIITAGDIQPTGYRDKILHQNINMPAYLYL